MTDQPQGQNDPFAPPDSLGSYPPPSYAPPSFPPPTGAPLPPPQWTADPYGAAAPPPRRGRGWLIAAAVVAGVAIVGGVGYGLLRLAGDGLASLDAAAGSESAGVWISEVPVGRCYILDDADRREDVAGYVTLVDCRFAHDGQVYAVVPLTFDTWPGQREVTDAAGEGCRAKDALLDEAVFDESGLTGSWYTPFEADWDVEEHNAQCVVESDGALGLQRSWLKADASASSEPA